MSKSLTQHVGSAQGPVSAARKSVRRTLEIERQGLEAVEQALGGDLGAAFADAADLIEAAGGNVIVTGMGKSGHVGRKVAATLSLHRHAKPFRASGRGEPR